MIPLGALLLGGAIGLAFGALQTMALRRNTRRAKEGSPDSGWMVMPGSAGRIAMLLLTLAAVQLLFPLFFGESYAQWLVSAGVVVGYGITLLQRVRELAMRRP